ncbi:MAG: tetratricopeptide repeat protein [Planctomycetes bacterium]|nr:tetratricopeptide repeat protein [Planctomycetota bacterium]
MRTPGHRHRRGLARMAAMTCLLAACATTAAARPDDAPAAAQAVPAAAPAEAADAEPRIDVALREETFEVARQAVKDFPADANALGLMGTVCNYYCLTTDAVAWWRRCIEVDPTRADAYHAIALVACRRGQYEEAIGIWRKAREAGLDMQGMCIHHAIALLDMGKSREAIAKAEEELARDPENIEAHLLIGKACLGLQEHEKAAAHYERASRIKPDDSRPYYGLMAVYTRLGSKDKAAAYTAQFREARAAEDKDLHETHNERKSAGGRRAWTTRTLSKTHTDAGRLYATHGDLDEAETHWRRAAALCADNKVCRHALIDLYLRSGRERQALTFCEQLRQLEPASATYHLNTGVLLTQLQLYDAAEEAVRRGLALAPDSATAHLSLVRLLLFRSRMLPEAQTLARRLVELAPTVEHCSLLAEACRRNGDLAGARAAIERAMKLDPGNEAIKAAYKQLQEKE